ncbi:MAG: putative porin [Leptospira sp.]|nr:putative porin [Leptospira sp.]
MFNFFVILLIVIPVIPVFTQTSLSVIGGRNEGEHVFETGNKYANLSGIRGGSRITYLRNYNYAGIDGSYRKNKFLIKGKYTTTGGYVNSGGARDEDFFLRANSTENGAKLDTRDWSLHDTANTFTGTQNFADGKGRSSMYEYSAAAELRYYLGDASPDPGINNNGIFLLGGIKYSYFKFYLYDVIQYVASSPVFYGPIGLGLSYSNSVIEFPFGLGYIFSREKFSLEASFQFIIGLNNSRDFHYQRGVNFISYTGGPGFIYKLEYTYKYTPEVFLKIGLYGHRLFTRGSFRTKGGYTSSDILSNYAGDYGNYVTTKESGIEFSAFINFNTSPKVTAPDDTKHQPVKIPDSSEPIKQILPSDDESKNIKPAE